MFRLSLGPFWTIFAFLERFSLVAFIGLNCSIFAFAEATTFHN
jgi:hypothetical protein